MTAGDRSPRVQGLTAEQAARRGTRVGVLAGAGAVFAFFPPQIGAVATPPGGLDPEELADALGFADIVTLVLLGTRADGPDEPRRGHHWEQHSRADGNRSRGRGTPASTRGFRTV